MRLTFALTVVVASGCGGATGLGGTFFNSGNPVDPLSPAKPAPPTHARCDFRMSVSRDQCADIRAAPSGVEDFQTYCSGWSSARFTPNALCDARESLGGCESIGHDRSVTTTWYYRGTAYKSVEQVKADCDSRQTFVAPRAE